MELRGNCGTVGPFYGREIIDSEMGGKSLIHAGAGNHRALEISTRTRLPMISRRSMSRTASLCATRDVTASWLLVRGRAIGACARGQGGRVRAESVEAKPGEQETRSALHGKTTVEKLEKNRCGQGRGARRKARNLLRSDVNRAIRNSGERDSTHHARLTDSCRK